MRPDPLRIGWRAATAADADFLATLYASTRAQEIAAWGWDAATAGAFTRMQQECRQRAYRERHPQAACSVIEVDAQRVGCLWLDRAGAPWRLLDLSLLPAHRGLGIGGCVLRRVLEAARAGAHEVGLQVEHSNPARRLYARCGFAEVADIPPYIEMRWRPSADAAPQASPEPVHEQA